METIASISEQKTRLWAMAYDRSGDVVCCENCGTINKVRRLSANCSVAPMRRAQTGPKDFSDIIAGHVEPNSISQLLLSHGAMPAPVALPIFQQVCRSLREPPGRTLQLTGSAAYMSPEQCLGQVPDERSQVYSLGCLMYEALTGKPPFVAEEPLQIMMQHVSKTPARVTIHGYAGALKLAALLRRCLNKKPARRYQSLAALEAELEQLQVEEQAQPRERSKAPEVAAAVGLAVLLSFIARGSSRPG